MNDQVARILMESRGGTQQNDEDFPLISEEDFDGEAYLKRNPDVAKFVRQGNFPSAYDHYKNYGRFEGRALGTNYTNIRDKFVFLEDASSEFGQVTPFDRLSIDALLVSPSGGIMIVGWADDAADPIDSIVVSCGQWQIAISAGALIRVRREDVEASLGGGVNHSYGFFGLHFEKVNLAVPSSCEVFVETTTGQSNTLTVSCTKKTEVDLREVALSYLAHAKFFSNYQLEAISNVSRGFGKQIISLNQFITDRIVANPYIERFGSFKKPLRGSIVVCLYGKAEYLFLQSALFSKHPGIDDYEFIYVSNSPELTETLLREAKVASSIYGICITIVLLEGNAGFGAANNEAAKAARSKRILTVNPDVFPRDLSWAAKHSLLVEQKPKEETQIFGVPLYYDDGSLMHGGMYFELDKGILLQKGIAQKLRIVRVEHYGKGAPTSVTKFTDSRPIPAVTGAFISSDRDWYEKLGGFTEQYVFGHYEDADLCLKSMVRGTMPWMHDLRLWHLEGKGSTRRPVHEGGSLVNRWLFSSQWADLIENAILGPYPDLNQLKILAEKTAEIDESEIANVSMTVVAADSAPVGRKHTREKSESPRKARRVANSKKVVTSTKSVAK